MNGVFKDDAERDRAILELLNNSKLLLERFASLNDIMRNHEERLRQLEKLTNLQSGYDDHECRLRKIEDIVTQHGVWIWIISSGIVGLVVGIFSRAHTLFQR